jgi:DMSO/TMAO reductase YedYZ heme-binding membrane subunit
MVSQDNRVINAYIRLVSPAMWPNSRRLRRFWLAGLTPAAIAVCTLAAVGLAGLVVIGTSMMVMATGRAGTPIGGAAGSRLNQALVSSSGELALLALTVAVVLGVAATGRHLLPAMARVRTQLAHRAVALSATGFLLVHILTETVSANAPALSAVLPFAGPGDRLYLGFGTIASDLVLAVAATSLSRMRYATSAHPWRWRVVHRLVYVAWPLAIAHGILTRGLPVWAAWLYGTCAVLVAVAVAARVRLRNPASRALAAAPREWAAPADLAALPPAAPWPPGYSPVHQSPASSPRPGSVPPWAPARHPRDTR